MHKKPNKKIITLTIIALCVLIIALGYAWYTTHQSHPSNSTNTSTDTTTTKPKQSDASTPTTEKTTNQIPPSTTMSMTIDTLEEKNGIVTYSGTVTNPAPNGACSAVFTSKINRPVTSTPTYSNGSCGPASIPAADFTSIGTWTLTLRYFTNDSQVSASRNINIQ